MKRVLLVDDHAVVRRGLREMLQDAFPELEVMEAENAQEALTAVHEHPLDAVVLDVNLPGRSGLEVLKRVKAEHRSLPVLILSIYPEEQYGIRMLRAGASGYLTKSTAPENLVEAVKKVVRGGQYISPELAERLVLELTHETSEEPHHDLSDREYQVFRMIASGRTVSDIAAELCLSVKTVSTHRSRILEKMGKKNNAELTHYAIKRGLVD